MSYITHVAIPLMDNPRDDLAITAIACDLIN